MKSPYLPALLGKLFHRGVEKELRGGLNFSDKFILTPTEQGYDIDVDVPEGGSGTSQPVDAVATSNVDTSAPGFTTLDGASLTSGTSRILLTAQSTASQNGIYQFNGSGSSLTRTADCDEDVDLVLGQTIYVKAGTRGKTWWRLTAGTTIAGSKTYERIVGALAVQDPRGITQTPRELARMIGIDVDDDPANGRTQIDHDRITIKNYGGASKYTGSATTFTCTGGSGDVALAGAATFRNGNWILLHRAGVAHGMSTPAAPTVVVQGATGASTISIKVVAVSAQWGYTAASAATTITNAPSSYSASNYVEVFCADVPGAHKYLIYAQFGGSGGTYNLIGAVIAHPQYNEHGQIYPLTYKIAFAAAAATKTPTTGLPATAPSAAVPNAWRTRIISGGGTTSLTVSPVPRSTVTGTVWAEICNLIPLQDCIRHSGDACFGGHIRIPRNDANEGYFVTGPLCIDRSIHLEGSNDAAGLSTSTIIMKDGCGVSLFNTTGAEAWSPGRQTRVGDRVTYVTRGSNALRTFECTAITSADGTWGVTGTTEPVWVDTAGTVQPTDGEVTWRAWQGSFARTSTAQQSSIHGIRFFWPDHVIPCGRFFVDDDYRDSASGRTLSTLTPNWQASTAYGASVYALPTAANANGKIYVSSGAGTSGGSEPTWPKTVGATVVDGTITWTCVDQKFVQGAMVLVGTALTLDKVAVDGGRGCGFVFDGCSYQTGGAINALFTQLIAVDRIYGGHAIVQQGSDGSACVHLAPHIGVPGDVASGNVDHGSCALLDVSFYGNIWIGILCDGGWRAQNRRQGCVQSIGVLLYCYWEGTSGADADWNIPSQITGGLLAGGIRPGCTPVLNDYVNPSNQTAPFSSWKSVVDYVSGIQKRITSGVVYTETNPNTTTYLAKSRAGMYRTYVNGATNVGWEHGVVTAGGNQVTMRNEMFSHRGLAPTFPVGLCAGDRTAKIQAVTAFPTLGAFLPGDYLPWVADGSAAGPPRAALVAKRRGVIGATARANSTAYIEGQIYYSTGGRAFVVVTRGTTAASEPAALNSAAIHDWVTDGTCLVQCWNTTNVSPLLQAVPIVGERVALTDLDQTVSINAGTHFSVADPAANRTITVGRGFALYGDEMVLVVPAATSFSVTFKENTSGGTTLLTVPAGSGFTSMTVRMNDAGVWERIR